MADGKPPMPKKGRSSPSKKTAQTPEPLPRRLAPPAKRSPERVRGVGDGRIAQAPSPDTPERDSSTRPLRVLQGAAIISGRTTTTLEEQPEELDDCSEGEVKGVVIDMACVTEWHRGRIRKAERIQVSADCRTFMLEPSNTVAGSSPIANVQWTVSLAKGAYFEVVVLAAGTTNACVCVGCAAKNAALRQRVGVLGGKNKAFGYVGDHVDHPMSKTFANTWSCIQW